MGQSKSKHRDSIEAKHCVPLGLYPRCAWPQKTLKKLICDKKLSPIFKGVEDPTAKDMEECPICFFFYPCGLNRSSCCKQPICTECFIQIKETPTTSICCPFCNKEEYKVIFTGPKSKEERRLEEEEARKVREAEERMREEEIQRDKERARKREEERERAAQERAARADSSSSSSESLDDHIDEPSPRDNNVNNEDVVVGQHHEQYLPDFIADGDEGNIEELMIAEAIRLSLLNDN